jgi:hypothetical protein
MVNQLENQQYYDVEHYRTVVYEFDQVKHEEFLIHLL